MPDLTAAEPVIDVRKLCVDRGGTPVLKGLHLSVNAGEVYALLGGNGAGKSTTLAVLMGLLRPSSGSVRVMGLNPAAQADAVRQRIAYLPETVALYETLSAYENIGYFLGLSGARPSRAEMDAALDAAGLQAGARSRRTGGFSKGMRQKVAIAMALLREVPVLLLDEPTTGLDPAAASDFNTLVGGLRQRGAAVLMVTHDLLGAADCADRIGFLAGGGIVEEVRTEGGLDVLSLHRRFGEAAAG
ncbi:ABC transporter ATP-binding protein [Phenylobacterium parvum]|uniref:ABC transporter ATP-binding protein n=1 Tax=Phenylobacterium parvum TaxID=2201350 RepID=A0A2Z3HKU4_9CAUL|nr:ABC transporter ATP-binding protein [Phenylobacterium parvum]AWM76307.1 ABC transporter ATP-binding protein [Phenylobacterium parvum]